MKDRRKMSNEEEEKSSLLCTGSEMAKYMYGI
jgi:hypothetical protein